jgi:hypothetical protein
MASSIVIVIQFPWLFVLIITTQAGLCNYLLQAGACFVFFMPLRLLMIAAASV